MNAIILAAGAGRRLGPVTARLPKCLVPVGGRPIITHMLDRLERSGIRDVTIVTGFEAEQIATHVARRGHGLRIRLSENTRFADTNNLYSLSLALSQTVGPVTIINGDDLFNGAILDALLRDQSPAAAVVDFTRPLPGDAMKVTVDGRRVSSLGKTIPSHLAVANAIGMYRFSGGSEAVLRAEIRDWVAAGRLDAFYVAAIDALASRIPIAAVSTAGLTWCEVDDVSDLAAAQHKLALIALEEATVVASAAGPTVSAIGRAAAIMRSPCLERTGWSRSRTRA